jgi:hypothetical protein
MDEFNRYIFINYSVQMTESLTISRLALNIYFSKYLKDSKILLIKKIWYVWFYKTRLLWWYYRNI